MSHLNNSGPPWRRILVTSAMLGCIVIAVGAAIALLLQNEANRASLTKLDQKLDALTQKTDRLQQDLSSLATDTPALTPSKSSSQATEQPAATPRPALTRAPTGTPRPIASAVATPVPPPTPAGPGICGRSPTIQNRLLSMLKIPSCQAITEPELFRITERMTIGFETPPQPGDFTGLVNLQGLSIEVMGGETLPAGTFHGLDNLKTLTVSMQGNEDSHSTIEPGAFAGVPRLEGPPDKLASQQLKPATTANTPAAGPCPHPGTTDYKYHRLDLHPTGQPPAGPAQPENAGNSRRRLFRDRSPRRFRLHSNLFESNPALEVVEIRLDTNNTQIDIAKDTLMFNVNYFCRLTSIILAGSPPYPAPAAGPLRSGSWGR